MSDTVPLEARAREGKSSIPKPSQLDWFTVSGPFSSTRDLDDRAGCAGNSPSIRQRTTPRRPRKEPQDDQRPYILTGDHSAVEDGEQDVGEDEEVSTAEDFGEGGPEEGTDDESEDEAGCYCWVEVGGWWGDGGL